MLNILQTKDADVQNNVIYAFYIILYINNIYTAYYFLVNRTASHFTE